MLTQKIFLGLSILAGLTQALHPFNKNVFDLKFDVLEAPLQVNSRMFSAASVEGNVTIPPFNASKYPAQFFNQYLDHKSPRTFKQKYYVNADHYKPGGPVFLYIGGESAQSARGVGGLARHLAIQHSGVVYTLEHRYYGVSHPFDKVNSTTLQYLSSEYGLKDLANFITKVKNPITHKNQCKNKKYAIGGSYAGAMAAWLRQAYPQLIDGAINSSGPVLAQEEFYEYDLSIGSVVGDQCLKNIDEITTHIDQLFEKKDPKFYTLKEKLGCSKIEDDKLYLYTLADTLATLVQYNNPSKTPNVEGYCKGFQNTTTIDEKIDYHFNILSKIQENSGSNCLETSYQDVLYDNAVVENNMMKQWTWQCCTEFGYWQTAPKPSQSAQLSTRSKFLTTDFFNDFFCSAKVFGTKVGPPNTAGINHHRGGLNIETNRIIFTNGNQDPWAKLSRTDVENSKVDRPILIIKNGSHVNDLGTPNPKGSIYVQQVQEVVIDTIARWINEKH